MKKRERGRKKKIVPKINPYNSFDRWWIGPWQLCPVSCGDGALRKRTVMCVATIRGDDQPSELTLPDQNCDQNVRPDEVEPCPDLPICKPAGSSNEASLRIYADDKNPAFYNVSETLAVASAGSGSAGSSEVNGPGSTEIEPPEILEFDNVVDVDNSKESSKYNAKPKWQVSKWSYCANGRRSRRVFCSTTTTSGSEVEATCGHENKPTDVEECKSGKWVTGELFLFFFFLNKRFTLFSALKHDFNYHKRNQRVFFKLKKFLIAFENEKKKRKYKRSSVFVIIFVLIISIDS